MFADEEYDNLGEIHNEICCNTIPVYRLVFQCNYTLLLFQ